MSGPNRHVLVPGRHHLLTRFQARYLADLLGGWLVDTDGEPMRFSGDADVIWAVTSANHQNTRRNPIPANRREVAIELFSQREEIRSLVVPVVDVPETQRFAEITLKAVAGATGERLRLTPDDTVVATSTPSVIDMYRRLGFRIAPLELDHPEKPLRAWEVLLLLADERPEWRRHAHPASQDVVDRYGLDQLVRMVMADPIVGSEGSLTSTRDYRTYAASFETAAERKWVQARPFIRPGRIVDVGCATGAMLELAASAPELGESDLYGIEVSRHLYEECVHKKAQGVFANPNTFFYQRNILAGPIFPDESVDTTLTFALTHEIYSYGGGAGPLRRFVETIFAHTAPGGVWINSDVCGPGDADTPVRLVFDEAGLDTPARDLTGLAADAVREHLTGLTPAALLPQFASDFRRNAGVPFPCELLDERTARLSLRDAMEFLSKYRYVDNWLSETHEQFCALSWQDWTALVGAAGFVVDARSGPWRNEWLVDNALRPVGRLEDDRGRAVDWPVTHMLLVAQRPVAS